jgi:hypothetical protein
LIRNVSLATRLALLVAGTTLPMILFAAGVIYPVGLVCILECPPD